MGGAQVEYVKKISPGSIIKGSVSKEKLREDIKKRPELLKQLEKIVSPLLKNDRKKFLLQNAKEKILIFDLPLLFENKLEKEFDLIITVSVSEEIQKKRVLKRKTMDKSLFSFIKSKQMPDKDKRKRADYVFQTNSLEKTEKEVDDLLRKIGFRDA